jgi:SPP1 gp7 family putative phage head morphogenesis protein
MTTAVQVNPYQVDQQQGLTPQEEAVVAAVALFLASVVAVKAINLPGYLIDRVVGLGLNRRAVRAAGKLTLEPALTGRTRWGSPTVDEPVGPALTLLTARPKQTGPVTMARRMAANEPRMRALYLLAAAKRISRAAAQGRFTACLAKERTYLDAHRRAGVKRAKVAREYDEAARGQQFLRWLAVMDERTSPDCAARNGSIWSVANPPFPPPGAQHPHCRCRSVPVHSPSAAQAAA